jgi:hypothetical protein
MSDRAGREAEESGWTDTHLKVMISPRFKLADLSPRNLLTSTTSRVKQDVSGLNVGYVMIYICMVHDFRSQEKKKKKKE